MRIAVVGPCNPREFADYLRLEPEELPIGLGGTPVNSLVKALLEIGHSVHLIGASPDLFEVERFEKDNLAVSVVPYRQRPRDRALDLFRQERKMMARELRRIQVDVVHAHWSYEFGWVGVTSGLPHVLTVHDAPLTILRRMPDAYRLLRACLAYKVRFRATSVTAVSPDLAAKWKRQMCFRRDIRVVPNIIPEFDRIDTGSVRKNNRVVVTDIADSTPLKNVRRLLIAFSHFRSRITDAELRLIGTGLGADDQLAIWTRKAGLSTGVHFIGRQSRTGISQHLQESSMLCHTSLEESQGMCFLEAMWHSVPVIGGRNSGGAAWTLDNGEAGLLVDVTSIEEIQGALAQLHENLELRESLIKRGNKLVSGRYSAESVAMGYMHSYQQAIFWFEDRQMKHL